MSGSVYNVANDVQNVLSAIFTNGLANSSPLATAFSDANADAGTEPFQQLRTAIAGFSGGYQFLQLATTEVAFESTTGTPVYTAVVLGSGMSVSNTDLGNTLGISGTISSIKLYSGGSFANGVVTGGTVVGTATFTGSAWTLTSGTATLTIAGDDLPTSVSAVDAVLAGNYSGPDFDISSVSLSNNGAPLISASLSAGEWTITSGPLEFALAGSNLPTGALTVEALIDGSYTGPAIGVSSIEVESAGSALGTLSLSSTGLTITTGGYALALDGTDFPASLTAAQIDSAVQSGNLGVLLGNASATSVTLTDLATGKVELTRVFNDSASVDLSSAGIAAFIDSVFLTPNPVYFGQSLFNPTVSASESLNIYYGGNTLGATVQNGGYEVVNFGGSAGGTDVQSGGYEIVSNGGSVNATTVQDGGILDVLSGGTAFITQLEQGGGIDLSGLAYSSAIIETVSNEDPLTQVTLSNGGSEVELTLYGTYTSAQLALSDDGEGGTLITDVACFHRGTRILTNLGEVAVEDLAAGDIVMTHLGPQRIKFIGQGHYDGRFVGTNRKMLPVCITAGALAPGVPTRDLHVSPGHGLLIDGVLVRAGRLVNGANITQAARAEQLSYYHIELDRHGIVYAENCPAESFYAEADFPPFQNEAEFLALYPEGRLAEPRCAELVESGQVLARIERRILRRSKTLARGYIEIARETERYSDTLGEWRRIEVHGWAQYLPVALAAQPVKMSIALGRARVHALANFEREDLREAGIGTGRHAFRANLTAPADVPLDRLIVRVSLNGQRLAFTEDAQAAVSTTQLRAA